jgi:hypothetical protein
MDYWAETMQDDCYLIAADGWREAASRGNRRGQGPTRPGPSRPTSDRQAKFKTDLIPPRCSSPATSPPSRPPSKRWKPSWPRSSSSSRNCARNTAARTACWPTPRANDKDKITKAVKARSRTSAATPTRRRGIAAAQGVPRPGRRRRPTPRPSSRPRGSPGPKRSPPGTRTHRGRDQDARGGRQVAGHARRRRAGRTGPRLADPHRPHPPARRTLRRRRCRSSTDEVEALAAQGGGAPQEDGGGMGLDAVQRGIRGSESKRTNHREC